MRGMVALASAWALMACGRAPAPPAAAAADTAAAIAAPDATLADDPTAPAVPTNRRPSEEEGRADTGEDEANPARAFDDAMVRGEAALYSGRFEDARLAYLEAMELAPESTAPALGALRSMVIEGHAEARADIAARIRHKIETQRAKPETLGASYLLGARLALALGETGTALDEARLAVTQMPDLGVAWRVLGEAAMATEAWGEAVEALQTAVSLGLTAESGTWERLADCFDELGEVDSAVDAARQALDMTGGDAHARRRRLNLLAAVLKHAGDLEGARRAVDDALALGPDDPAVLHNVGAIAQAEGRPDAALAAWEKATASVPVPQTLWRAGRLLLELDRPGDALKAFQRAAAHLARWGWPDSTRWLPAYEVGKLFARAERPKEAIGWFEDALREARTAEATREIVSWLGYVKTLAVDAAPAEAAQGPR